MKSNNPYVEQLREKMRQRTHWQRAVATLEIALWWQQEALPTLKDHALSELRRWDQMSPYLIAFTDHRTMVPINIMNVTDGKYGDHRSKAAATSTHRFAAAMPGIKAAVLMTEMWILNQTLPEGTKDIDGAQKHAQEIGSIAQHPDREEAVGFNMLHHRDGQMMQLMTTVEVLKLFASPRLPQHWQETKFGKEHTIDPMTQRDAQGRPLFTGNMVLE